MQNLSQLAPDCADRRSPNPWLAQKYKFEGELNNAFACGTVLAPDAGIHNDTESDLIAAIYRTSATASSNGRFDVASGSGTAAEYAFGSGGWTGGVFNG
jgi:hypothetical protein